MRDGRKIWQWEFWPFWAFYAPVYGQLVASALRNGAFAHFCCANPGIPYGGLLEYSKNSLTRPIAKEFLPATVEVPASADAAELLRSATEIGVSFPMIVKPDRGERGFFVEKIDDQPALDDYVLRMHLFLRELDLRGLHADKERLLVQEYVTEREEFGVMWVHHPDWECGRITSIVHKQLLSVVGDGRRSLGVLVHEDERAAYHESMLREVYSERLSEVPSSGELVPLVEIGNHSRGATFRNATPLADDALVETMTPLAHAIPGFSLGRFDIRAAGLDALRSGDFKVIEVNAVNSEPAHIYDPANRLRDAYGDLLAHWRMVEAVAKAHRRDGCTPPTFRDLRGAVGRHAARLGAARAALAREESP